MTKLIRSQTCKGRIIDSLFFGSFAKASIVHSKSDSDESWSFFTYCPGPRSIFILQENSENVAQIAQGVSTKNCNCNDYLSICLVG